jgi:hypothetical protein
MLDLFGLNPETRMFIRLYIRPILFLLVAFILEIMGDIFQDNAFNNPKLTELSHIISTVLLWGSLAFLFLCLLSFLHSTYRYWKWYNGNDAEICHVCGGMVTYKDGKYGPYYKCLGCGKNRSVYR